MNLGNLYSAIKQYDKAYEYYQYCLVDSASPSIIKTHRNLANLHALRMEEDKAIEHYRQSIAVAEKMFGPVSHDLGLSYMYLGKFLVDRNDPACLGFLQKAHDIFLEIFGEKNRDIAMTWNFTGNFLAENGATREAIAAFRESILAAGVSPHSSDQEPAGPTEASSDIAAFAYGNMARVCLNQYLRQERDPARLIQCLALFDTAISINRSIREAYQTDDSKLIAIEDFHVYYQLAVYAAVELFEVTGNERFLEKGFSFSEKARASQLHQAIREADAKIDAGIPSPLLAREREIKNDLASYSHLLHKEIRKIKPDSVKIDRWRHQFFGLKKSYDSIVRLYENEYPDYYYLKYDTSVVSSRDMMHSLRREEALLEYMVLDSIIIGFCITREGITASRVRDKGLLREYFSVLSKYHQLPGLIFYDSVAHRTYLGALAGLHDLLIAPFGRQTEGKKLIIVQDHLLSYIPFEILVRTPVNDGLLDFSSPDYLLRHHAVSYTPSASLFQRYNVRKGDKIQPARLLAVAPHYLQGTNDLSGGAMKETASVRQLPGAMKEAREISEYFNGDTLLGPRATETNFKRMAPAFRMLHFALHTEVNDESPMFSRLVFNSAEDTLNDGNLNTYEIYNLDIEGSQVVMSSCQSGAGKVRPGEGMMNLVRAFQYIGFPSVIATLWDVEDESSSLLMKKYYARLRRGMHKNEAIRYAKIDYMESISGIQAHPYFWAGFIHFGSSAPVSSGRARTSIFLLIFVSGITILYFLFDRYKQEK